MRNISLALLIALGITLLAAGLTSAQTDSTPTQSDEDQQKEKEARDKKAFALLEDVINETQMLKLPENRIRLQVGAADLLWGVNESRARSFFMTAADAIAEMMRTSNSNESVSTRQNQRWAPAQLRQELILTVARHDAPLAYQLLAITRQPITTTNESRNPRAGLQQDNLEERLLSQIAPRDPKLAMQKAEQMLDKGQYPRSLPSIIAELQKQDSEAAAKFEGKVFDRLRLENLLANADAAPLVVGLLQPGPRPAAHNGSAGSSNPSQVLRESDYVELMGAAIDWGLKAPPRAQNDATNQAGPNTFRGRMNSRSAGGSGPISAVSEARVEQNNGQRLLRGLQLLLPQIDQYLPSRAPAVRQKVAELGFGNDPRGNFDQMVNLLQQGTAESLLSAAQTAPPMMQPRIYQQAALKALDEGDLDRARQIANDHLDAANRERVLQTMEFRQVAQKAEANKMADLNETLARLKSDDERVDLLVQLAGTAQQDNPKLALQLLEDARQFTSRRANNYQHFERQLKLAQAFKGLAPERSFEVLEPGIMQLNELLSAAAVLSGFEVNVFREGEMPLQGGSSLGNMVARYGQELGTLAQSDFERAQTLANRFQFTEPRIMARLSIVKGMLGMQVPPQGDNNFGFRAARQNTFD